MELPLPPATNTGDDDRAPREGARTELPPHTAPRRAGRPTTFAAAAGASDRDTPPAAHSEAPRDFSASAAPAAAASAYHDRPRARHRGAAAVPDSDLACHCDDVAHPGAPHIHTQSGPWYLSPTPPPPPPPPPASHRDITAAAAAAAAAAASADYADTDADDDPSDDEEPTPAADGYASARPRAPPREPQSRDGPWGLPPPDLTLNTHAGRTRFFSAIGTAARKRSKKATIQMVRRFLDRTAGGDAANVGTKSLTDILALTAEIADTAATLATQLARLRGSGSIAVYGDQRDADLFADTTDALLAMCAENGAHAQALRDATARLADNPPSQYIAFVRRQHGDAAPVREMWGLLSQKERASFWAHNAVPEALLTTLEELRRRQPFPAPHAPAAAGAPARRGPGPTATDQCRACSGYGHWANECPNRRHAAGATTRGPATSRTRTPRAPPRRPPVPPSERRGAGVTDEASDGDDYDYDDYDYRRDGDRRRRNPQPRGDRGRFASYSPSRRSGPPRGFGRK